MDEIATGTELWIWPEQWRLAHQAAGFPLRVVDLLGFADEARTAVHIRGVVLDPFTGIPVQQPPFLVMRVPLDQTRAARHLTPLHARRITAEPGLKLVRNS